MTNYVPDNDRYVRYLVTDPGGQSVFDIDFPLDDVDYIEVYEDGSLVAADDYTVSLTALTVTLDTLAAQDSVVTLQGRRAIALENAFPLRGDLDSRKLNNEVTNMLYILQELRRDTDRQVILNPTEPAATSNELPLFTGNGGGVIIIKSDESGFDVAQLADFPGSITVTLSGVASNDMLVYTGSAFENKPPAQVATLLGLPTLTGDNTFTGTVKFSGPVQFTDDGELTIAAGAITVTGANHTIDTEGDAASDDLDTISGGADGMVVSLRIENDAREVVLKDGAGNIETPDGVDITLSADENAATLIYDAALSKWIVTSTFVAAPIIASQAEAEAGTNNTKFITPLRAAQAIAALGNVIDTQSFDESTGSGTWTKPSSGTYAFVRCGGGGGAGCFGTGEGGGGGGACVEGWFLLSDLGTTETVTIGAGGSGANSAGGNTTFGSHLTAYGGGHGNNNADRGGGGGGSLSVGEAAGAANAGGAPDGGAAGSSSVGGDSSFGGGGSGDGAFSGGNSHFGGGGGAGKDAGNGGNSVAGGGGGAGDTGTGGTSVFGGNGGDGNATGAGDNGSHGYNGYAGGGGGGSGDGSGGGDGGDGSVLVIVF